MGGASGAHDAACRAWALACSGVGHASIIAPHLHQLERGQKPVLEWSKNAQAQARTRVVARSICGTQCLCIKPLQVLPTRPDMEHDNYFSAKRCAVVSTRCGTTCCVT